MNSTVPSAEPWGTGCMLRLQTVYGDLHVFCSKDKTKTKNAKRVLTSGKGNMVIYCIEGCREI